MSTTLLTLLLKYKYIILIPIVFIEGPTITIFCGVLWKLGLMNGLLAALVATLTNLVGDVMWYYIGFYRGEDFIKKFGHYFNLTDARVSKGEEIFLRHGSKILVFMKVTSGFGMIIPTLFASGMYKMNFKKYMLMNAIGETVWSFGIMFIGYFFSHLYTQIQGTFSRVGFISFVTIFFILVIFNLKRIYNTYVSTS